MTKQVGKIDNPELQKNVEAGPDGEAARVPDRSAIERLAYMYWEERGCPDGSGEEDWSRAEQTLRAL